MRTQKLLQINTRTVDENGKEKNSTDFAVKMVGSEPAFIKMYLNDIRRLSGVSKQVFDVLLVLMQSMGYDNRIILNSSIKKNVCEELKIYKSVPDENGEVKYEPYLNVVDQAINKLLKHQVLFRESPGVYQANTYLIGRGKWADIKRIRLEFNYDEENGRYIKVEKHDK